MSLHRRFGHHPCDPHSFPVPLSLTLYLSSTGWSMCPLLQKEGRGLQTAQCWALPRGFLSSPTLLPQNNIQLVSVWGLR